MDRCVIPKDATITLECSLEKQSHADKQTGTDRQAALTVEYQTQEDDFRKSEDKERYDKKTQSVGNCGKHAVKTRVKMHHSSQLLFCHGDQQSFRV